MSFRGVPMTDEARRNMRAAHARRRQRQLDECRTVCNEPFRRRYLELTRSGAVTPSEICREMNWLRKPSPCMLQRAPGAAPKADVSRLLRTLGLKIPPQNKNMAGPSLARTTIDYDQAVRLAEVLAMDPHEAGL